MARDFKVTSKENDRTDKTKKDKFKRDGASDSETASDDGGPGGVANDDGEAPLVVPTEQQSGRTDITGMSRLLS